MKKFQNLFLISFLVLTKLFFGQNALAAPSKFDLATIVSGEVDSPKVFVYKNDLVYEEAEAKALLRLGFDARSITANNSYPQNIRVEVFKLIPNSQEKVLMNVMSKTVTSKADAKYVGLKMALANLTASDNIFIDLYNSEDTKIASYRTFITVNKNVTAETTVTDASCAGASFGDCQIKYLLDNIRFEVEPRRSLTTQVKKQLNGKYTISVPMATKTIYQPAVKPDKKDKSNAGGVISGDGGLSINDGTISFYEDSIVKSLLGWNKTNSSLEIKLPELTNSSLAIDSMGKVKIGGVNDSDAYLTIKGSDSSTASLKLKPGSLTTTAIDGALEYDGNKLYFTKAGIRTEIGQQGPQGLPGAAGPQGPAGASGATELSELVAPDGSPDPALSVDNDGNVSIGTTTANQLLTVNGIVSIKETAAPTNTATFGKLYVSSSNSRLYFLDDSGAAYNLTNGAVAGGGGGGTPGGSNTQFQFNDAGSFAGNGALAFTKGSKTLTIAADAPLDINSTSVSIADTNITLDGASTAFTQTTGAITMAPAAGSNFNLTLSGAGDFAVNSNQLYVDSSTAKVGINDPTPTTALDVNGTISAVGSVNGLLANFTTANITGTAGVGKLISAANVNGTTANFTDVIVSGIVNGTTSSFDGDFTNGSMLFANAGGVISQANSHLYWDRITRKLSIGVHDGTVELLTLNGNLALRNQSSAPSATEGYGKLFVNGNLLYFMDNGGTVTNLVAGGGGGGDAATLDTIDSTSFLRSDTSDSYTSGTLTFDAGTTVDINSTTLQIADTDITLDGANTTFTQTTGAITLTPANGSNLNVNLLGLSDFAVDTNKLFVNNNGDVAIGITNPNQLLTINGVVSIKETAAPSATSTFGKLYVSTTNSKLYFLDDSGSAYNLTNGAVAGGGGGTPGGSNTQFQFNDGGSFAGNGALAFTKASKTLSIAADAPLDINSTSLSIADTDISFDGASTTFTQTTGAITMAPAAGSNFNLSLSGAGDFAVNTNQFYVDTSTANVGIYDNTPSAKLDVNGSLMADLYINSSMYANTSGATITVDWNLGNIQTLTLNQVGTTVAFTNPSAGYGRFVTFVKQDATGSRTVTTWDTDIKWPGGSAPTLSTAANAIDVVTCIYDGTNYFCQIGLDFQ